MGLINDFLYAANGALALDSEKKLGLNRSKESYVDFWQYKYAWNVARKPDSVTELKDEVLKSPEILSRILTIMDDVLPGYEIVCEDEKLKESVEDVLVKSNFFRELHSSYLDFLVTGEGFMEPVFIREKDIDMILNNVTKSPMYKGILNQNDFVTLKELVLKQNPEMYEPREIYWVPSDTIYKMFDEKGKITGFKQIINGQEKAKWNPEALINISAYKAKSEIYGFTPLLSFLDDLVLLKDSKNFVGNFFKNNGVPDYIISLDESKGPNDPSYKKLEEVMKERRKNNERGSLVASGKLTIQALNQMKDMDFQVLLQYLGDNLDLIWRIPPQKLRGTSAKTRDANAVLRPYFARIKKEQKFVEDVLNSVFFVYFGNGKNKVKIKLNNSSSVDQVTDVTWASMMYHDGAISLSEYREALGKSRTPPNDLEENPFIKVIDMQANPPQDMANGGKLTDNRANPNKTPKQKGSELYALW